MNWQPIETAQKDRLLDLWQDGRRYGDCYYDPICDHWRTVRPGGKLFIGIKPTHWMLPPDAASATIDTIANRILNWVMGLSDRTSPDDWPEAMLVTGDELVAIVKGVLGEVRL